MFNFVALICFCYVQCNGEKIQFSVKQIPEDPVYLPKYRMEHAERNTSKEYDYWKQMDIHLIEWPGNITKLEVDRPLLRWGKHAKLVHSPCNVPLGMRFQAYAHNYLHLTWGPFRLTSSYCPPFKLARTLFQNRLPAPKKNSTVILSTDFEFVSDSLLIIVESRVVIRVGEWESAIRHEGSKPIPGTDILTYTMASGVTSGVTKLVTQNCCKNRMTKTCEHGDIVLAFDDRPPKTRDGGIVFVSDDTGKSFRKLSLRPVSLRIHAVLVFPRLDRIVALQGDGEIVTTNHYSLVSGLQMDNHNRKTFQVKGKVQAQQIGEEDSILVWDKCSIWYSYNAGINFSMALFYIHDSIHRSLPGKEKEPKKHHISTHHCYLGGHSRYAHDPATGKVALLDSQNNFFYGIDTMSQNFSIIGSNMDMTLLLPNKLDSIAPSFDFNNRPKLMYPPRYLYSDDVAYKDPNYRKRLGIRLFPRSVFPSDFMPPFFSENIPQRFRSKYGLEKCRTSSIVIDSALSQKPKIFYTTENSPFNFTLEFKSVSNSSHQLNWIPKAEKQLKITAVLNNFMRLGLKEYYYFKYNVTILPKPIAFAGTLFRLNVFTRKSLRCVHQPQVTIWIRIDSSTEPEREPLETTIADPEPVKALQNFLKGSEIRKVLHEKNPMKIQQCSQA